MRRLLVFLFLLIALTSCLKREKITTPPDVIPDDIYGIVYEFNVTPINITTPDKGFLLILMNNSPYKVEFNAADQAPS
ncbi:MAG: hypothetical protein ICV84_05525, partial [Flavisolibacter sp.]|nr:hypothetical protein [Flavisolibacter sp.]